MIEQRGVFAFHFAVLQERQEDRPPQIDDGLVKATALVEHPSEAVDIRAGRGHFGQGVADHFFRLVQVNAGVGPGVAEVVAQTGVVRREPAHLFQLLGGLVLAPHELIDANEKLSHVEDRGQVDFSFAFASGLMRRERAGGELFGFLEVLGLDEDIDEGAGALGVAGDFRPPAIQLNGVVEAPPQEIGRAQHILILGALLGDFGPYLRQVDGALPLFGGQEKLNEQEVETEIVGVGGHPVEDALLALDEALRIDELVDVLSAKIGVRRVR